MSLSGPLRPALGAVLVAALGGAWWMLRRSAGVNARQGAVPA
ncbi:hypothetical protein [Streptomyces albidoflavus]|nr:hypothetical protein [Streptomyces albidoflavus]